MDDTAPTLPPRAVSAVRLCTAASQAVALLLLTPVPARPQDWAQTHPSQSVPLFLVALFVPFVVLFGVGRLRPWPLAIWAALAAAAIAALGWEETARDMLPEAVRAGWSTQPSYPTVTTPSLYPRWTFYLALTGALAITHSLVVDALAGRQVAPHYRQHFDTAWKLALQLGLAFLFMGVLWAILWLSAGLFDLVGIDALLRLLQQSWFIMTVSAAALAAAIHFTDVAPALLRGTRTVVLALFAALLPLLVVSLAAFLVTLPFVSLRPLLATHHATGIMLATAALLVLLINCAYQDGAREAGSVRRAAAAAGAVELLPIIGLAAVALGLRVRQHGWTVGRIEAAVMVAVFAAYALGYASAVIPVRGWLRRIEGTNVVLAYALAAAVLLLFSPVADPGRLMVASQMSALKSGSLAPDKLDTAALLNDGARWGAAALRKLSMRTDPASAELARRAGATLSMLRATPRRVLGMTPLPAEPTSAQVAAAVLVLPAGRSLPPDIYASLPDQPVALRPDWEPAKEALRQCVEFLQTFRCVARYMALQPGAPESLLLLNLFEGYVLQPDTHGAWHTVATLSGPLTCPGYRKSYQTGTLTLQSHALPDIVIAGHPFVVQQLPGVCP